MCKWGCSTGNMMFKCKYCGKGFCSSCSRGDFPDGKGTKSDGKMRAGNVCGNCGKSNHRGDKL